MRRRMVGLASLAAALAISLFGVPLAAIVVRYFYEDERGEIERTAAVAAVTAAVHLASGRPLVALPHRGRHTKLAAYDGSGGRIVGDGPDRADLPVLDAARQGRVRGLEGGSEIVVAVPISTGTAVLGVVRASTRTGEVYTQIGVTWLVMAGLAAVALAAAWFVARRMAARLIRPLDDLTVSAHALGDGDFSTRFRTAGVTEIDSLAEALNSTAGRLSDLVARERAFTADASHQLRSPLTALRLGLEVALEDPRQDPRRALDTAVRATDRLQATVEDLLTLARGSGHSTGPLALRALLDELVATWQPPLAVQERAIQVELHSRLPVSGASTAAVRQILAVLVDNAMAHGRGAVTVTARDVGATLAIDVADEGPELITPAAELFERRGPAANGHGIGLPLARRLAEAEGGRLSLSRTAPPTFTLFLPGRVG